MEHARAGLGDESLFALGEQGRARLLPFAGFFPAVGYVDGLGGLRRFGLKPKSSGGR